MDQPQPDAWLSVISEINGEMVKALERGDAVDPTAMKRMVKYLLPEARKVSPVATMFLALAVREMETSAALACGEVRCLLGNANSLQIKGAVK